MVDACLILAPILLLGVVALLRFIGCTTFGSAAEPAPPAPVPTITSISPESVTVGGPIFTLTVNGSGFINEDVRSIVQWNGSDRYTTFFSDTKLTATIPASDIATAGKASVTVFTPPSGGGTSNSKDVTIDSKPAILGFDPPDATAGDGVSTPFELTVNGSNFSDGGLKVKFDNTDLTPTPGSVTDTVIKVTVPANLLATARNVAVTVTNGNGGTSDPQPFTIFPLVTVLFPGPQPGTGNNLNFDASWGWETGTSDDPFSHIYLKAGGLSGTFTFANGGSRLLKSMKVGSNSLAGHLTVTDDTTNPAQPLDILAGSQGIEQTLNINWRQKSTTVSVAFNNPNSLTIHKISYQGPA